MIKQKVLKFKQNGTIDLTENKSFDCNVVECGRNRFTLHQLEFNGYENGILYYSAVLYVNNQPFFTCIKNSAGVTKIVANNNRTDLFRKSVEVQLKKYKWSLMGHEYTLTLEFIADNIANSCFKNKEL